MLNIEGVSWLSRDQVDRVPRVANWGRSRGGDMGWVKLKLRDRDSKKNRARHTEVASKRLSQVFSSNNGAPVGAPLPLSRRSRPRHRTRSAPRQVAHIGCGLRGHCNASASFCDGVIQLRVCRGRPLSWWAAKSRSAWVSAAMSVPLGKYWRNSPLVFSFEPRCHGDFGSQK